MQMSSADWIMLIALSCLWGASYFFNEIALVGFPVLTLVTIRIAVAALVLWLWVALRGGRVPRSPKIWLSFLVMGLLNNVIPFSLIVWGQTEVTSSLAAILNATTPFFAVVVAAIWLHDEPVSRGKIAAVAVGFVGVTILIGPDVVGQVGGAAFAQIAIVLASLSYSLASVYGRRFHAMGYQPAVAATCQVTMSSLLLGGYVLATGGFEGVFSAGPKPWAAATALAVFSTAIAYILYFRILASAGAVNLMLVTFLMPVMAILLGVFILHESLSARELLGMFVIALALLVVDGRLLNRRRKLI